MKLMLIFLLLITSLMTVVGAFLITSVSSFYTDQFYQQMDDVFGQSNAEFVNSLRSEAAQSDGVSKIQSMIEANAGRLGIDYRTRNYYILDSETGSVLYGSDEGASIKDTVNLLAARNGELGQKSDPTASYMDVAIPISGGDNSYIIYVLDNRETVSSLNSHLFMIIMQALLIGLLISLLLSFLLSKTMVTPIERLTDGAERVAAGDFEKKIDVESNDEIGILTTTFNDMAGVLHNTLAEVESERNKLDTLFLHMTDGVVAFSRDGSVIHCNPAASGMLGRDVSSLKYADIFGALADFSATLALERPNYTESEMTVGSRVLEVYMAPFSGENSGGVMAVLHDVTEQRKTEEMRREFVANVSHELRTPLTNIRSYAETLHDSKDVPPDTANSFLEVIMSETDRMTHIVQDLLTLSKFDYGREDMSYTDFSASDMIDDVCRAVGMDMKKHSHTLVRRYGELPSITADRGRIEQVLMNIVANSIKYTPDGGTITVSAGNDASNIWIEVDDNGIGIPAKDRERIFERFYRVDKARSRESGGTGLGLSIAREIVARHGGTIGLVDRDGPGTTVRITLPISRPEEKHE
jgi:two-component system sensor histidine kinase VicK